MIERRTRPIQYRGDKRQLLCRVVAPIAEALKRCQPEFVDVAVMRLDVIADCRWRDDAAL
jgi:hypothetical protein